MKRRQKKNHKKTWILPYVFISSIGEVFIISSSAVIGYNIVTSNGNFNLGLIPFIFIMLGIMTKLSAEKIKERKGI